MVKNKEKDLLIKTKNNINKTNNIKNNKPKSNFFKWIFLFLVLLSGVIAFLLSPIFNIQNITVINNERISAEEIINLSGLMEGENIFKIFKLNIINQVKENPYIESVRITRELPDKIVINVEERMPTYMLKIGNTYAYINNQGYILEFSDVKLEIPVISGYYTEVNQMVLGNRLILEDLVEIGKIIEIMNSAKSNDIDKEILEILIESDRLVITLKENKIAYISQNVNLNVKIMNLKAILEREKGKNGEIFLDGISGKSTIFFRERV